MNSTATQKPLTSKAKFVKNVAESILSGTYEVGQRLPTERELAAQMNMSKSVVHSGLERLDQMGLINIKPQSGIYVADYIQTGNIETLNAIVKFQGNQLSYELDIAILDLRLAIEGTAMQLLAQRHTAADIAKLRSLTEELRIFGAAQGTNYEQLSELFFNWHHEICILSRSNVLPLLMNTVHNIALPFWVRHIKQIGLPGAIDLLDRFTDLLEAGDGTGARDYMQAGIQNYIRQLEGVSSKIEVK